jgi:tetratricopeptide (TPR) repeat protein
MSRDGWFRNTRWDDSIAELFEAKLRRARTKGQYLRIQACMLCESNPAVALSLLDRYFAQTDERFDDAQAHVDRASALLALGRADEAVDSYEEALRAESRMPNLLTQAYIELPYLIAVRGIRARYTRALEVLKMHRKRLTFPVDHFKWNAAQALLAGAAGNHASAREFAEAALEAAAKDHSGFRYHAKIGLVSEEHSEALRLLRGYCDS